jgi:hypothetical protein
MAEEKSTYQTQFTADNILELKDAINKGINDYVVNDRDGQKLDLFVIITALQQAAYEVIMRSMPANDTEARKSVDEMKVVADKIIDLVDTNRKEMETKPMTEILATIHSTSLVTEFYARRRDEALLKIQENAAVVNGDAKQE